MIEMIFQCGEMDVPPRVMAAIIQVESSGNPFAIGVVGDALVRQPRHLQEAIATVKMLESAGKNYSLGVAQINKKNFSHYGIRTIEDAFDYCTSIKVGAKILSECFERSQNDWKKSFSCYYSGNFVTGFKDGYVQKVDAALNKFEEKIDGVSKLALLRNQNAKITENSEENSSLEKSSTRTKFFRKIDNKDIQHEFQSKQNSEINRVKSTYPLDPTFVF